MPRSGRIVRRPRTSKEMNGLTKRGTQGNCITPLPCSKVFPRSGACCFCCNTLAPMPTHVVGLCGPLALPLSAPTRPPAPPSYDTRAGNTAVWRTMLLLFCVCVCVCVCVLVCVFLLTRVAGGMAARRREYRGRAPNSARLDAASRVGTDSQKYSLQLLHIECVPNMFLMCS